MADPLRVAVMGCGSLADVLAERVYPQVNDAVQVVAAIDIRRERAQRIAALLGARAYASLADACAGDDVEAVDIRLPHDLHLEGARAAAAMQLPFLVEKPLAADLRDAREIAHIASQLGPSCAVAENYGFLTPVLAARSLLEAGRIGDLLIAQTQRIFMLAEEWRRDGWRLSEQSGASGVIVDQASHVARLLQTVVGEVAEVFAMASSRMKGWAGPDSVAVAFRTTDGIVGTQTYTWACPTPTAQLQLPELTLYGSGGSIAICISYDGPGGGALLRTPGSPDELHGGDSSYYDSLAAVLDDWARAVRARRQPSSSIDDGLRDVHVMAAIAQSAQTRRPIVLHADGHG